MITAVHTLVYADDPDAARAFFRDVLGWPNVDAQGGWLIFGTGPSELGVHPTSDDRPGREFSTAQHHEIALICDDVEKTMAELTARGAQFSGEIGEQGFGRTVTMKVPGASDMLLYEPRHPTAYEM
ncbi:MAG TPA: VOC family protein [Acidimicrobiales bacterium]|nr:VOC family protein [Acidimicrobiales bacterium]